MTRGWFDCCCAQWRRFHSGSHGVRRSRCGQRSRRGLLSFFCTIFHRGFIGGWRRRHVRRRRFGVRCLKRGCLQIDCCAIRRAWRCRCVCTWHWHGARSRLLPARSLELAQGPKDALHRRPPLFFVGAPCRAAWREILVNGKGLACLCPGVSATWRTHKIVDQTSGAIKSLQARCLTCSSRRTRDVYRAVNAQPLHSCRWRARLRSGKLN
jgi:hypothetical protein